MKKYKWLDDISSLLREEFFRQEKEVSFYGRKKIFKRSLKWVFPFKKINLNAPSDSVIHLRFDKEGIILVSKEKGIVLKIFSHPYHIKKLKNEVDILKNSAKIYLPQYLFHGEKGSLYWLAVKHEEETHKLNIDNMFKLYRKETMDSLADFYLDKGIEKKAISEWMDSISKDYAEHPLAGDFEKVKTLIKKELKNHDFKLIKTTIHGDIHTQNLIWKERPIIIDWEGSNPNELVFIDFFDPLKRYLQKNKPMAKEFKKFLSGEGKLSLEIHSFFQDFYSWYERFFEEKIPAGAERLIFMIYALDRAVSCVRGYEEYSRHAHEFNLCLDIIADERA